MLKVVILAVVVVLGQAEIFDRACRTVEDYGGAHAPFNPGQYLGTWYEIERYDNQFQDGGDCVTAQYTLNADGSITVFNTKRLITDERWETDTGIAWISFPDEEPLRGMLNVTFAPGFPADRSNYWILGTDYVNYALVVSCTDLPATQQSSESYWLLARSYPISAATRARADGIIDAHLERSRIRQTLQGIAQCFA